MSPLEVVTRLVTTRTVHYCRGSRREQVEQRGAISFGPASCTPVASWCSTVSFLKSRISWLGKFLASSSITGVSPWTLSPAVVVDSITSIWPHVLDWDRNHFHSGNVFRRGKVLVPNLVGLSFGRITNKNSRYCSGFKSAYLTNRHIVSALTYKHP